MTNLSNIEFEEYCYRTIIASIFHLNEMNIDKERNQNKLKNQSQDECKKG